MGVIKFSTSLRFYMYCRTHRVFQDLQNLSYSGGGVANSIEPHCCGTMLLCLFPVISYESFKKD